MGDMNLNLGADEPITLQFLNDEGMTMTISGATTFTGLTDTPSTITPLKFLRGNESGDAIEFADSSGVDVLWGDITGTLSDQEDLQDALDLKYNSSDFDTDFDTAFLTKSTTDLSEGDNLYYTDARVSENSNVVLNSAKISYTDAAAVALNSDKISFDSTSSTRLSNTSGLNTGDQDLSNLQPLDSILTNTTASFTTDLSDNISTNNDKISYTDSSDVALNTTHRSSTDNPHSVDKIDVGLSEVPNLSFSGSNTGDQIISDETISTSDITTNDVSTSKHGFAPKGNGLSTSFLNGNGDYSTPAGSGNVNTSGIPVDNDWARFVSETDIEGLSDSEVRSALDLEIGTDIQAYSSDLDAVSGTNTGDNSVNTLYSGLEASKEDAITYPTEDADTKYYRGDKTFHEIIIGSGGYASNVYLSDTASTDPTTYKQVSYELDSTETEETITVSSSGSTEISYLFEEGVAVTTIPAGTWRAVFYGKINSNVGDSRGVFTIFKRETDDTETDLFSIISEEMSGDEYQRIVVESSQDAFTVNSTDRIGVRCSATATSGVDKTINYIVGDGRGAYFNTPLSIRHDQLRDKNGEDAFQHLTLTNKTDLTDSGDTNLHYHSSDRNRTNHTGTQTASTISDFDTEVSNNDDVTENSAKISFDSTSSTKLGTIAEGAEVNVQSDWDSTSGDSLILNKPTTITTTQASNITTNNAKVTNQTHTGEVTGSTTLTIANNIIDEANLKLDETPTNDYVLTADSTKSGGMKWSAVSSGFSDPMTTRGDIIYKNSSNSTTRLPIGTDGQVLSSDGTDLSWEDASGGSNSSILCGEFYVAVTLESSEYFFVGSYSDESYVKTPMPVAGTWKKTYLSIYSNGAASATTLKSRINGANGNQSISITASTTGSFSDTTHTDSISAGDLINYYISGLSDGEEIYGNWGSEYLM